LNKEEGKPMLGVLKREEKGRSAEKGLGQKKKD